MKKIILLLNLLITAFYYSQNNNQNNSILFARIINYDVIIKDTSSLKHNLNYYGDSLMKIDEINIYNSQNYIDHLSFIQFLNVIKKYLNDKNAFAIRNGIKVKPAELISRFYNCDRDSVPSAEIDENGNEIIRYLMPVCDSSRVQNNIRKINFTESWSIDAKTYELKKDVLAFTLYYWHYRDDGMEIERELFTIYKNLEAFEKIKSFNN
jgi:hypothetical protein